MEIIKKVKIPKGYEFERVKHLITNSKTTKVVELVFKRKKLIKLFGKRLQFQNMTSKGVTLPKGNKYIFSTNADYVIIKK